MLWIIIAQKLCICLGADHVHSTHWNKHSESHF